MSKTKVYYMDVKEISSDATPELLTDMLAGDKSIIRKVFGIFPFSFPSSYFCSCDYN
jgi:hypothetical protein